jgi:hypothetical protein
VLFTLVGFATEIVFLRFFGIETLSVRNWLFLKVAYICILSAKIIEFIVLRMVQPDWQRKVDKTKPFPGSTFIGEVKNPLPTISSVKEVYGAVAANIAMNIIMGYVMGDVYIQPDKALVVKPTNPIGLGITGVILGGLTAFLVTKSVLKTLPVADNGKKHKTMDPYCCSLLIFYDGFRFYHAIGNEYYGIEGNEFSAILYLYHSLQFLIEQIFNSPACSTLEV